MKKNHFIYLVNTEVTLYSDMGDWRRFPYNQCNFAYQVLDFSVDVSLIDTKIREHPSSPGCWTSESSSQESRWCPDDSGLLWMVTVFIPGKPLRGRGFSMEDSAAGKPIPALKAMPFKLPVHERPKGIWKSLQALEKLWDDIQNLPQMKIIHII